MEPAATTTATEGFCVASGGLLVLNGVYDLVCALAMVLMFGPTGDGCCDVVADLHADMLEVEVRIAQPAVQRFWGYWIATHGCIRIAAGVGLRENRVLALLAALSLFVEGAGLVYEAFAKRTVIRWKAGCVALLSIAVGILAVVGGLVCLR